MRLLIKTFLPIIVVTLVISTFIGITISEQIKENAINRAQLITAEYISSKSIEQLTSANFQDKNFSNQFNTFDIFLKQIQTNEIIKIKIFNLNHDIIYSTAKENIGQKTDSKYYETALKGDIAVQIKDPIVEQANIELKGYKQVMEIYVPIVYNGKVEGVIETYYKMDFINSNISDVTINILGLIGVLTVLILTTIYLVLTFMVTRPINALRDAADKITDGELDTKLPEVKSNDEVSSLIASIEMLVASYKLNLKKRSEENEQEK